MTRAQIRWHETSGVTSLSPVERKLRAVSILRACLFVLVVASFAAVPGRDAQPQQPSGTPRMDGDRVVLVTLDGARTQEMFGGLDVDVLKSTLRGGQTLESHRTYQRFWAPTPEERRRKLMPFFWGALMTRHGSIAGNRALGSTVSLGNRHWFSYPGYSELVVGEPHDDVIKSNDAIRNPYSSVFEALRERLQLPPARVATFASWGVFNEIVEHREGATFVNAGPEPYEHHHPDASTLALLQREASPPWDNTRFDVITVTYALRHLARERPRVLYLALDETDDWAHDGRYDRLLDSFWRTDRYLEQLWTWIESQPDYNGRTHMIIATDHGRGRTPADWRDHSAKVQGADEVWLAFVSPRMPQRGEWRQHPPLSNSQVAATLAAWLGVDWKAMRPTAGAPIQ
jgi:hypothetical protein